MINKLSLVPAYKHFTIETKEPLSASLIKYIKLIRLWISTYYTHPIIGRFWAEACRNTLPIRLTERLLLKK